MSEQAIKRCGKCGAENEACAVSCASCGAVIPRGSYGGSVEAGLKHLEKVKLTFLDGNGVISKFDPETLAAYAMPEDSEFPPPPPKEPPPQRGRMDILSVVGDSLDHLTCEMTSEEAEGETSLSGRATGAVCAHEASVDVTGSDEFYVADLMSQETTADGAVLDLSDDECKDTVDVSAAAQQVRDELFRRQMRQIELEQAALSGDASAQQRVSHLSSACVIRKPEPVGQSQANRVSCEAGDAMAKLKQLGVFEPVRHQAVDDSLMSLNALIPESDIAEWKGAPSQEVAEAFMDLHDMTRRHEESPSDEALLEASESSQKTDDKENRRASASVEGSQQIVPLEHGMQSGDADVVETIPINMAMLDAKSRAALDEASRRAAQVQSKLAVASAAAKERAQADLGAPTVQVREGDSPVKTAFWLVLILILFVCIGWLLYLMGVFSLIVPEWSPERQIRITSMMRAPKAVEEALVRDAIREASFSVELSVDTDLWLEGHIDETVESMAPEQRGPWLDMAMDMYPQTSSYYAMRLGDRIEMGAYGEARALLSSMPPTIREQESVQAQERRLYESDPLFEDEAILLEESNYSKISPLGGGSTLTFKVTRADGVNFAFKPLQTRRQSNYRAEIAAYRLCELISCDFSIPKNVAIKIEKGVFERLYNRADAKKREAYRKELVDLIWTSESDGRYVYGTLKDWVPDFTRFPIEYTSMWQPWLKQEPYMSEFGTLESGLSPLRRMSHTSKLYVDILRMSPELTLEALARQVSEVLTFDYLIGNWDRFSGVKAWWGVNCQYKDGEIVSIDNGASFPTYVNDKVSERFMMTERFSRHFIEQIKGLDKAMTQRILFPNGSESERQSFERFWSQRERVLERVEALSATYGSDKVLSFE